MTLDQLTEQATFLAYRLGAWAVFHLIEDPAVLALVFC